MKRRDVFKGLLATGILLPISKDALSAAPKPSPERKAAISSRGKKDMVRAIAQVHELLNNNPAVIKALASEGYRVDHAELDRLLWEAISA